MLQATSWNDRLQPRKRGLSRYEMCSSKSALRAVESDYRPGADVRLKDSPGVSWFLTTQRSADSLPAKSWALDSRAASCHER
jgi:hypothetical protein